MELLIFYLSDNGRHYTFEPYIKLLNESATKRSWKLIILTHGETTDFYRNILNTTNIIHEEFVFSPDNNYLKKVNFAINYSKQFNFSYMMKCDNDVFIRGRTLDYIIEHLYLLDNTKNLTIGPVLSSGIPCVEYFIEQFLTKDEQSVLYRKFLETRFTNIWGAVYMHHNKHTICATKWNKNNFFNDVRQNIHHYKGIHPIRVNLDSIRYLNSCIINNKYKFYENRELSIAEDNTSPYLCNSIFCIKTGVYESIISNKSLYIDDYDEVPLNKYAWANATSHLFVNNGFGLHMYYNTIPNHRAYEAEFCSELFKET